MTRVVVKMGTRVLTCDDGRLARDRLAAIVENVANMVKDGKEVILVSSGAVGLGRDAIGLPPGPSDLATRQACAAIGQSRLMGVYEHLFETHQLCCAQVLLTQSDFDDKKRYDNLTQTLSKLLQHRVVPIVNENDVVATEELAYIRPTLAGATSWGSTPKKKMSFGDNDQLASILASKLEADLLVLLTDVAGVYDKNPYKHPDAVPIRRWTEGTEVNSDKDAGVGRGGMRSKIRSATQAARAGCTTVIASGRETDTLQRVLTPDPPGTWFPAIGILSKDHQWIGQASATHGVLIVRDEALRRLATRHDSLYTADVLRVEGQFAAGQVVEIRNNQDAVIGRGATVLPSAIAKAWAVGNTESPTKNDVLLVRWDQLIKETAS